MKPANLWHWEGRADRSTYLLVGAIGFSLKLVIDYLVMTYVFHRSGARFSTGVLSAWCKRFDWRLATRRVLA